MTQKTKKRRNRSQPMLHASFEVPQTYETWRCVCAYALHTAKPDATMEGRALLGYARRLWRAMLWTEYMGTPISKRPIEKETDLGWPPRHWEFDPYLKGCPNTVEFPLFDILKERNAYFWRKAYATNSAEVPEPKPRRQKAYRQQAIQAELSF